MAAVAPRNFDTREAFRANLRVALESAVKLATVDVGEIVNDPEAESAIELPEAIANIPVVTVRSIDEALNQLFSVRLSAPSQLTAEVRTPATINVWARCPNCGIHASIPVLVSPQLVMTSSGGELKLKASSKGRIHTCNQLVLDGPDGQLRAFEPDTVAGAGTPVEDVSDDADDAPAATPEIVHNMLLLVSEEFPRLMPSIEEIRGWDQVTLELVADWASSVHLRASDHEIEIPDLPAVLTTREDPGLAAPDEPTPITKPRRGRAAKAEVDVTPDDRGGELQCQGSNHVPGHTPGCPSYVAPAGDDLDDLPF